VGADPDLVVLEHSVAGRPPPRHVCAALDAIVRREDPMRFAILAAALLAAPGIEEECTPAPPEVIAAAEREAAAADARAAEAESIAVRSGNPGADARARKALADARAAHDGVARLKCQPVDPKVPRLPGRIPARGY
jgi:hypothetical protein